MTPEALVLLIIFCSIASLASLLGGSFPSVFRLTHTRLQLTLSFIGSLMLGLALLVFLPHAAEELHAVEKAAGWMLAGFLVMFLLQRVFHYHQHEWEAAPPAAPPAVSDAPTAPSEAHDLWLRRNVSPRAWVAVACGLAVHSVVDGMSLAATVMADSLNHSLAIGAGAAVAVTLHKPFDGLAVLTMMHACGASRRLRWVVNVGIALTVPIGAGLALAGIGENIEANHHLLGSILAFCAGSFLCISCSDLLPELFHHQHDRLGLSLALAAGLAAAALIAWLDEQQGHAHDHAHSHAGAGQLSSPRWRSAPQESPVWGSLPCPPAFPPHGITSGLCATGGRALR